MSTETNTALAEQKGSLKAILTSEQAKAQFAAALPRHMTAERFSRVLLTALTRTPKLQECTRESFFKCCMDLSAMGLEADGRRAHLIPYGKECTLVVDYKGIAELAMRSGLVGSIHADKVCENDQFEANRGKVVKHVVDYRNPRGAAYAYYALITFKDGSEKSEVMTKDEVDAIRKRSRSGSNGPWVTDYDEMAKKTVFKRASKWLSLSPEIRLALEHDDDERLAANTIRDATPGRGFAAEFSQAPAVDVTSAPADQDGGYSEPEMIPEGEF